MSAEIDDILAYWFDELGPDRWWTRSDQTDETIRDRFEPLWQAWRSRTAESFLGSARDALAGVILFDQFPRNIFRGSADAFSTDPLALAIARGAVDRRLDDALSQDERSFLYMPFMHSEDLDDQDRALLLFTALGNQNSLDYAHKHHDVIARFGRFPHRNAVLGRAMRPGEEAAAKEGANW
ncbi:DUF924 family protein [Sphingomonas colocasiae]|uniref:DUF924 domain-containing protein n=1 Tax=Sphingomonas colocasiae TaxID=1848973 RepID=A0ABS7PML9_9SPHN|nr:DUF924 family protein [Sphingomonas colocasiae]MBY8822549.1 DUF924 domain-containing protein [Sphingomonas colocasiae]